MIEQNIEKMWFLESCHAPAEMIAMISIFSNVLMISISLISVSTDNLSKFNFFGDQAAAARISSRQQDLQFRPPVPIELEKLEKWKSGNVHSSKYVLDDLTFPDVSTFQVDDFSSI